MQADTAIANRQRANRRTAQVRKELSRKMPYTGKSMTSGKGRMAAPPTAITFAPLCFGRVLPMLPPVPHYLEYIITAKYSNSSSPMFSIP